MTGWTSWPKKIVKNWKARKVNGQFASKSLTNAVGRTIVGGVLLKGVEAAGKKAFKTKKQSKHKVAKRKFVKKDDNGAGVGATRDGGVRIVIHKRKKKKYNDKLGWKYTSQGAGNFTNSCLMGKQNFFYLDSCMSMGQMTTVSTTDATLFDVLPWDLNPFSRSTGSNATFLTGGANTTAGSYAEDRVHLTRVVGHIDILNCSTLGTMFVDIYWVIPKNNIARWPDVEFANSIINDAFLVGAAATGQSADTQRTGIAAGAPVAGYLEGSTYGVKPTQFLNFNKQYKVVKHMHYMLAAGEQRRTYTTYEYNKTMMKGDWLNQTDGISPVVKAGITLIPFIVFRGSLGVAQDTVGATTKIGTYAPVEITANYQYTYHWHPVGNIAERTSYSRVNPWFLNDTQGGAKFETINTADAVISDVIATNVASGASTGNV